MAMAKNLASSRVAAADQSASSRGDHSPAVYDDHDLGGTLPPGVSRQWLPQYPLRWPLAVARLQWQIDGIKASIHAAQTLSKRTRTETTRRSAELERQARHELVRLLNQRSEAIKAAPGAEDLAIEVHQHDKASMQLRIERVSRDLSARPAEPDQAAPAINPHLAGVASARTVQNTAK
jgi:hypothetical protein